MKPLSMFHAQNPGRGGGCIACNNLNRPIEWFDAPASDHEFNSSNTAGAANGTFAGEDFAPDGTVQRDFPSCMTSVMFAWMFR